MKSNKYLEGLIHGLQERTKCSMDLFGIEPISRAEAEQVIKIARKVANQLPFIDINEQLENELICQTLRSRGHEEYANMYSIVGIPVASLINTISGNGFESKENANLQNNAETSHKKGADDLFKKFYLKLYSFFRKALNLSSISSVANFVETTFIFIGFSWSPEC